MATYVGNAGNKRAMAETLRRKREEEERAREAERQQREAADRAKTQAAVKAAMPNRDTTQRHLPGADPSKRASAKTTRAGMTAPQYQQERTIKAAPAYLQYQSGIHADGGGLHRRINYDFDAMSWDDVYREAANTLRTDRERDDMLYAYKAHVGDKSKIETHRKNVDAAKPGGAYASTIAANKEKNKRERMQQNAKYLDQRNEERRTQYGAINALNKLDVITPSGEKIDWNTISFDEAIRTARMIPDKQLRETTLDQIKTMTKSGGRYAKHAGYDFSSAYNGYIANKGFDDAAFKAFMEGGEDNFGNKTQGVYGAFYPDGNSEENRAAYEGFLAQIESSELTPYQKHWYMYSLNKAYRDTTGADYKPGEHAAQPTLQEQEVEEAVQAAEGPEAPTEEPAKPTGEETDVLASLGSIWQGARNKRKKEKPKDEETSDAEPTPSPTPAPAEEEAEVVPEATPTAGIDVREPERTPVPAPLPAPEEAKGGTDLRGSELIPVQGVEEGKTPDAGIDPTTLEWSPTPTPAPTPTAPSAPEAGPEPAEGAEREAEEAEEQQMPSGSVHLVDDPIRAMEYVLAGRGSELDSETQEALGNLISSSTIMNTMLGVPYYDFLEMHYNSTTGEDDVSRRYRETSAREGWHAGDVRYIIGSTLGSYYNKVRNDSFPPELTTDAIGAIAQVGREAEIAYANGEFDYDPSKETLYDAYIRINPVADAGVRAIFNSLAEMEREQREHDRYVYEAAEADREAQIESARAAVRSGDYTQDQYELVEAAAPPMSEYDMYDDDSYLEYASEARIYYIGEYGTDGSWIQKEVYEYLAADERTKDLGLDSNIALEYRDVLSGYLIAELDKDKRISAMLGYESLEAYYARCGGFNAETLADRAKVALQELDDQIDGDALTEMSAYTGANDSAADAIMLGAAHGVSDTTADILTSVWSMSNMHKEDAAIHEAEAKNKYIRACGNLLAVEMYRKDMYEFAANHPSPETSRYITQYLDSGADPFRLGIVPENSIILNEAGVWRDRATGIQEFAQGELTAESGKTYELASAATANLEMQAIAAVTTMVTGSAVAGVAVGFGGSSFQNEAEAQLREGKNMKYAHAMGMANMTSTILAETATSGEFVGKIADLTGLDYAARKGMLKKFGEKAMNASGLGWLMQLGGTNTATNSRIANAMIGLVKGAAGQYFDEAVLDEIKEGIAWQAIGGATESRLNGSSLLTAAIAGIKGIDVQTVGSEVTANLGDMFFTMLPTIFLSGVAGAKGGWKNTRKAAAKMGETGTPESAAAFVEAFAEEVQRPENRAELDEACDAAATAVKTVTHMTTDPEIAPKTDGAQEAKAQETAHKKEAAASEARIAEAEAQMDEAQARMDAGEINPGLPQIMAESVEEIGKATQGLIEHTREGEEKGKEARRLYSEAMYEASIKAQAEVEAERMALDEQATQLQVMNAVDEAEAIQKSIEDSMELIADNDILIDELLNNKLPLYVMRDYVERFGLGDVDTMTDEQIMGMGEQIAKIIKEDNVVMQQSVDRMSDQLTETIDYVHRNITHDMRTSIMQHRKSALESVLSGTADKLKAETAKGEAADRAMIAQYENLMEEISAKISSIDEAFELDDADQEDASEPMTAEQTVSAAQNDVRAQEIDGAIQKIEQTLSDNPDAGMTPEMTAEVEDLITERVGLDAGEQTTPEEQEAAMKEWYDSEKAAYEMEQMASAYSMIQSTPLYVDASQRANILAKTGLKTLGQVNIRYRTKLTSNKESGAISLDGSFFGELAESAPGWIDAETAHPEGALIDLMDRRKANKRIMDEAAKKTPTKKKTSLPPNIRARMFSPTGNSQQQAPLANVVYTAEDKKTTVTVTPTRGKPKGNPVQTFKRLAKSLKIGYEFGTRKMNGLEGKASGFYDEHAGYAVSDTKHASSVETVAHEIGHAISDKLGLVATREMISKLPSEFAQAYDAADLPHEAFAEFFWRYTLSDDAAASFAGDAYIADFERKMRKSGMYKDVKKAQKEIRRYYGMSAIEKSRMMVRDKSDKRTGDTITEKLGDSERAFITQFVDSTRPAEDINDAIRSATGSDSVAEEYNLRHSALMEHTAPRKAWAILTESLTDLNGTIIGDSLGKRLKDSKIKGKDFDLLIDYMLAMHSIDRDAQKKAVFDRQAITQDESRSVIDDVENNHPEVVEAAKAFQSFRHDFMVEYMVKPGYLTEAQLAEFEKMYPHYVPTYRVKDGGKSRGTGGKTYTIRKASGSTEEIINPMDSFVEMVNTIVTMNMRNNTALTFDRVYNTYEGMGIFAREVTEDERVTIMGMEDVQKRVERALEEAGAEDDAIQSVLDIIGDKQIRKSGTGDVKLPNILTVQLPNGEKRFYKVFDQQLYDMFAGTQDGGASALDLVGALTRGMSMLTTGSNPLFAITNAARDFQNSVNYGSWATDYITGGAKWLKAAYEVWKGESADYQQYVALGGGGWTRVDARSKKGTEEYRGALFEGYNTSNVARTVKWAGQKVWNGVTLARLNEVIEQASRFAEYKYGQHDKNTAMGRQEAYLAAQDVTTDFSRHGNARMAAEARKFVPFFNAALQGIYRTGRQFTKAESDRAPTRFIKTVLNTGLASALASVWMISSMDDEDREEFFWLSDDMKAKHLYMPNFAPAVLGNSPLIRIPLPQDPLAYAVHAAVTNTVWSGKGEEWAIGMAAIASNIMNGLNPITGTVADPIMAMSTNKNWYGSNIVPRRMDGRYATNQYDEDTPDFFVSIARGLNRTADIQVSPLQLQYLAEQYTGFVGQMVIPFISKDHSGNMEGISAVVEKARNRLTSDPLKTNDVISCVYDSDTLLGNISTAMKNDMPMDMLRIGLSDEEALRAANEAYDMTHSGGIIYTAKKQISAGYDQIDEIEANEELTDDEKYTLISEVRREMCEIALDANEAMAEYREKYITGDTYMTYWLRKVMGGDDE